MECNKSEKIRNSSLELLRIICMFLIIFHHYAFHGGMLVESKLYFNEIIMNVFALGGKFACDIFILITGYFMINSKFNLKKIIKFIIKMFVYAILINTIYYIFFRSDFKKVLFIKEFMPFIFGNWFAVTYIMMYFISPFLNKLLKNLNQKDFQKLLVIIIIIWSIIPTYTLESIKFSDLDTFIVMYTIGAYIGLYDLKIGENKKNLKYGLIFGGMIIILSIVLTLFGKVSDIYMLKDYATYSSHISNILTVASSIYIFMYFKNIYFENLEINWIAKSMLGVYLLHDDEIVRPYLWYSISPNCIFLNSKLLIFHCIYKCFLIFLICVIIDKIMEFILKNTIYKYIDKKDLQHIQEKFIIE